MIIESGWTKAIAYFPAALQMPLGRIRCPERIQEIRLRIGRNLHAVTGGAEFAVLQSGELVPEPAEGLLVSRQVLDTLFQNACMHSVHSCQAAIRSGYLTIAGGNRVGLCGTAVIQENRLDTLRAVGSMNVRIASARTGCAEKLVSDLMLQTQQDGVLIAGAPASGKTTILRDMARILGGSRRIALMDERGELAAVQNGVPHFDVGVQTDVFDGYPKAEGIEIAARVMSPQWMICDEIGSMAEAEAMLQTAHTGTGMIASVHAGSIEELYEKPGIAKLIAAGVFRKAVMLGTGTKCGQVLQIRSLRRGNS